MAILLPSANPKELLDRIKKEISQNHIFSWEIDSDGDFRALGLNKARPGWFRPRLTNSEIVFELLPPQAVPLAKADFRDHHSRMLNLLLESFPDFASSINVKDEDKDGSAGFKLIRVEVGWLHYPSWLTTTVMVAKKFLFLEKQKIEKIRSTNNLPINIIIHILALLSMSAFALIYIFTLFGFKKELIAFPLAFSTITGLLILGTVIETTFGFLTGLHTARLFWLGALTVGFYIAHGFAAVDINSIFHIDATALPYATAAATVFQVLNWTFWPMLVAILPGSFLILINNGWREKIGGMLASLAVFCSSVFFVLLVGVIIQPDEPRHSVLYQIARQLDFNDHTRCIPLDEKDKISLIFIGPEQSRALLAPKLVIDAHSNGVIPKAIVPDDFAIVECQKTYSPSKPESPSKK